MLLLKDHLIAIRTGLTFDDVLLVPRHSTIESRFSDDIDLSSCFCSHSIKYPIISSNMDTVTGLTLALEMDRLGGLGIVHRFMTKEKQYDSLKSLKLAIGCIGVGAKEQERYNFIRTVCHAVLIDVAHGHHKLVADQIRYVKSMHPKMCVIAGNVVTEDGAFFLAEAGADMIKCGVGNGGVCTTRIQTGCGVPQLTALADVCKVKEYRPYLKVIADGGIRSSGDCVKALAIGADFVMLGGLFAGTKEAEGEIHCRENNLYKIYRGLASKEAQLEWKGAADRVEGEMTEVSYKGEVENIFNSLIAGIRSGMSYQNARSLEELRKNVEFIYQTSAGYIEGTPHGCR